LIERPLNSSEAHIGAGQSLRLSSSKVWRTLGGSKMCSKV